MFSWRVNPLRLNALWPSDAIWWHNSGSTLALIMACCLTQPSHYLNQCLLLMREVLWSSHESSIIASAQATIPYNAFENYILRSLPLLTWASESTILEQYYHPTFIVPFQTRPVLHNHTATSHMGQWVNYFGAVLSPNFHSTIPNKTRAS